MEEPSPSHAAAAAYCCPTCRHQDGILGGCLQGNPMLTPAPPVGVGAAGSRAPGWSHSARTRGLAGTGTMCQDSGSGWDSQPCCSAVFARVSSGCQRARPAPLEHAPLPGRQGAIRELAGSCLH